MLVDCRKTVVIDISTAIMGPKVQECSSAVLHVKHALTMFEWSILLSFCSSQLSLAADKHMLGIPSFLAQEMFDVFQPQKLDVFFHGFLLIYLTCMERTVWQRPA